MARQIASHAKESNEDSGSCIVLRLSAGPNEPVVFVGDDDALVVALLLAVCVTGKVGGADLRFEVNL